MTVNGSRQPLRGRITAIPPASHAFASDPAPPPVREPATYSSVVSTSVDQLAGAARSALIPSSGPVALTWSED